MPVPVGGFDQSYNAQAGVDIDTMMLTAYDTQACNDKREVAPTLDQIAALPDVLDQVQTMIIDNGFFSQAKVQACVQAGVQPLMIKRKAHCQPPMARFAPAPDTPDSMVDKLSTQAGKVRQKLHEQTVELVFVIINHMKGWRQMSMRTPANALGE
jgi:hypothetical protein